MEQQNSVHWADIYADKIIREKGEKELYTCASGITPSGTVHIGNFREIISVDLVVKALRQKGKNVRFIYSWDDYDVFRKVPKNMPQPELLETYLRKPITLVPDTTGRADNYARGNELDVEQKRRAVAVTTTDKNGDEVIVAILGRRIDDRFKITAATRTVAAIS